MTVFTLCFIVSLFTCCPYLFICLLITNFFLMFLHVGSFLLFQLFLHFLETLELQNVFSKIMSVHYIFFFYSSISFRSIFTCQKQFEEFWVFSNFSFWCLQRKKYYLIIYIYIMGTSATIFQHSIQLTLHAYCMCTYHL